MIVGLHGKAGVGKDTLFQNYPSSKRVAFADPIRDMIAAGFDIPFADMLDQQKKNAPDYFMGNSLRHMMQTLGTEWGRHLIHQNIWLEVARKKIVSYDSDDTTVFVTDVRFDNEAYLIHDLGGVIIEIIRPDTNILDEHTQVHRSETGLSGELIDFHVVNEGTIDELVNRVKRYLAKHY